MSAILGNCLGLGWWRVKVSRSRAGVSRLGLYGSVFVWTRYCVCVQGWITQSVHITRPNPTFLNRSLASSRGDAYNWCTHIELGQKLRRSIDIVDVISSTYWDLRCQHKPLNMLPATVSEATCIERGTETGTWRLPIFSQPRVSETTCMERCTKTGTWRLELEYFYSLDANIPTLRIYTCLPRCYCNGLHLSSTSIASRRHVHFLTVVWPPDQARGNSTFLDNWHRSWIHSSTVRFKCLTPKDKIHLWISAP